MPIDSNIALGVRPIEQPNMLAQFGQMMAIKAAQQEMEGNAGVNELARRGVKDPSEYLQYGPAGRKTYESILKGQKDLRDAQKLEVDLGIAKIGAAKEQLMANVNNPASAAKWLTNLNNDPQIGRILSNVPLEDQIAAIPSDPKAFNDWKYKISLKAPEFVQHFVESANAQLQARTSIATNAATNATTRRGQDLLDTRARQELHPIETGTGPGTYQKFGPNAGIINPMTQAPWQPPPSVAPASATIPMQGGGLGSGTYGMGAPNTLPATVGATTATPQANMLGQTPPATPAGGYTQAQPKGPTSVINVSTQTTASEEAQKEFMKSSRATYDQLKQAPTMLENIEKAKALVPAAKGFMGTGGETLLEAAKFMNNRLGTSIDTAGIKSAEELNTRAFMGILDNLKKLDAQPSQSQQAALKQALGSLSTDPSAMNAVLDVFGNIVRGKVDIHNQEVTGAEQRGVKFPYNPVIKLPEKVAPTAAAAAPMYATNGKERIVSNDGGATWQPVGAK